MKTAIGLYDDLSTAQQVVEDLVNNGFSRDRISLVANNATNDNATTSTYTSSADDVSAGEGAGIGAMEGGVLGLLAGLGALAIPGVGPVLAAGPLIGALIGATAGAVTGGLVAGLMDAGVPETDAQYFAEGVRRGGTLLSIEADESRIGDAVAIMNRYNPVNIDQRASNWQTEGFTGHDTSNQPLTAEDISRERQRYSAQTTTTTPATSTTSTTAKQGNESVIPVVQEELQVGKRQVEQGGVRVHSTVENIPVEEKVRLREEHVTVERRPADRPVSSTDVANLRDKTIEVTETTEVPVVSKQARVVEEVVVNKEVGERVETVSDTVRRTDVEVENLGTNRTSTAAFDTYNNDFRTHYQTSYGSRGHDYNRYAPAYRYGYTWANDSRYSGRSWDQIEADMRRDWDTSQGPWEDFKDAVRYGWDKVRGAR